MNRAIRSFLVVFTFCFAFHNFQLNQAFAAPTIKKLLEKAKPGQTVKIPSGTFVEDVIVPPGVSLIGVNAKKTIIVGRIQLSATPLISVNLSRVTLIHTGGGPSRAVACEGGRI